MRTAFYDATVIENTYQIGVADRRDAMRNDQRRAIAPNIAEIVKYLLLCISIYRRERIIEYQYPRIPHHRPCDRRSLFLSTRKCDAALANELLILIRKRSNIGGETGDLGGFLDGNVGGGERAKGRGGEGEEGSVSIL